MWETSNSPERGSLDCDKIKNDEVEKDFSSPAQGQNTYYVSIPAQRPCSLRALSPKENNSIEIISSDSNDSNWNIRKERPTARDRINERTLRKLAKRHESEMRIDEKMKKLPPSKISPHFLVRDYLKRPAGRKFLMKQTPFYMESDTTTTKKPDATTIKHLRASLIPHTIEEDFFKTLSKIDKLPQKTTIQVPNKRSILELSDKISILDFQAKMRSQKHMEEVEPQVETNPWPEKILHDVLFPPLAPVNPFLPTITLDIPPAAANTFPPAADANFPPAATTVPPVSTGNAFLPSIPAEIPPAAAATFPSVVPELHPAVPDNAHLAKKQDIFSETFP